MRPHTLSPLRVGQKPNAIEAGISGRALVQENLRAARGGVSRQRGPIGQICRPLDDVAQACGSGVAELKARRGGLLCITENDRRWGYDTNGNRIRGIGSGIVAGN